MTLRCGAFVMVMVAAWATVCCALAPVSADTIPQAVPPVSTGSETESEVGPAVREMMMGMMMEEGAFDEVLGEMDEVMASAAPDLMMTPTPEMQYMGGEGMGGEGMGGNGTDSGMWTPMATDENGMEPMVTKEYMHMDDKWLSPTADDIIYVTPSAEADMGMF